MKDYTWMLESYIMKEHCTNLLLNIFDALVFFGTSIISGVIWTQAQDIQSNNSQSGVPSPYQQNQWPRTDMKTEPSKYKNKMLPFRSMFHSNHNKIIKWHFQKPIYKFKNFVTGPATRTRAHRERQNEVT